MTKKGFWRWLLDDSEEQIRKWYKENKKDLITTRIFIEAGAGIVILTVGIILGLVSMMPTLTYTGPRTLNIPLILIACGSLLIIHGNIWTFVDSGKMKRDEIQSNSLL